MAASLASSNRPGRLRYANAQDLPSFPSIGLKKDGAAASAAATLGWANQKSSAPWKPDSTSNSASTAALLANDKMAPVNDPQRAQSQAGSQAAIMAASSARRRQHNQSSPPSLSQWGSSAANIAFKANRTSPQPSPTLGTTTLTRQGSMHAAKGAMAGRRPRSFSSPQSSSESYPDKANAASNALSAATIAHRPSMRVMNIPIEDAGAVPYTTMNRQMFTSHPPVKLETDEKKRNDVLHASAVAMAKQIYSRQQNQKTTQQAESRGRASSFTRQGEGGSHGLAEEEPIPIVYGNLQEAAYRLAQERLAKLQDEHQKNRGLQEYYGSASLQRSSKLGTIRNKLTRKRSSSDGDLMMEDQKRSRQIRNQMSLFNTKVMEVDESKRSKDREALLAAAQRNVKAQLQGMDDKIQADAGLGASSKHRDWEWKAQAAAQARVAASHDPNFGKVDLGGGKFMGRREVDQIAAQKVQPLLDEINKNAEREYERRAQQKADEEKLKEEAEKIKARDREIQAIHRKLKEQEKGEDKVRKAEIKQLEKNQKEQFKAAKAEQKRVLGLSKDGKQKEKEVAVVPVSGGDEVTSAPVEEAERKEVPEPKQESEKAEKSEKSETGGLSRVLSIKFHKGHPKHKEPKGKEVAVVPAATSTPALTAAAGKDEKKSLDGGKGETETEPTASPSSPVPTKSKVKTWLRSHFHNRSRSKSSPVEIISPPSKAKDNDKKGATSVSSGEGFIGGVALARLSAGSSGSGDVAGADKRDVSSPVPDGRTLQLEDRHNSMREVALAGRTRLDTGGGDKKGESSRPVAATSPVPNPFPVPNPVFATTASPDPPTTTARPEEGATVADVATKSVNHDGVSLPDSEREDSMRRDERSAVEKFANDWDTTITRDKWKGRTGIVSSLSSTDLSDEADSENENGVDRSRDSLDRFEEARSKADRPKEPPRADDVHGGEEQMLILDRPRPIARDVQSEDVAKLAGGARARPVRATSPYRGSRFSENFDAV